MANTYPIAGLNPPGSTGAGPDLFQGTLTPGYTGGFNAQPVQSQIDFSKVDPTTAFVMDSLFRRQEAAEERAFGREERLFDKVQAMRKREAQEAFQMQLPFKTAQLIGGQISNIFQNYNQAVTPIRAYEMAIRSKTPELLAQTYAANPFAGRKWLS